MYNWDSSWNWSIKSLSSPSLLVLFPQLFHFLSIVLFACHICVWRLWLKTFSISSVQFLQSVCLHPVLSCDYAFSTLCLSSFHHDDHACILLCLHLSTYSAASSSSLRNFLTRKFLSEEFIKIAYSPPLVDITHFHIGTLCLFSFHHDIHVYVMLCVYLSTYSAASSSSPRNFPTLKFLSEKFIKIAYSPPL